MFDWLNGKKKKEQEQQEEIELVQNRFSEWLADQEQDYLDSDDVLGEDDIDLSDLSEEDMEFIRLNYEERLKEIDSDMESSGLNFNTYQKEDLHDDLQVLDSYIEYDKENQAKFLMFNIRVKEENEEEWTEMWKAVKLLRIKSIPRRFREEEQLLTTWDDVLIGMHDKDVNFITLMANILKPERIGLVFCYGIQSVAETAEEAQKMASAGYQALAQTLMGNFSQIEFRTLTRQEADWIDRQMRQMKHLLMLRGIPRPRKSAGQSATRGFGGTDANTKSEEQNEEFLRGMSETEYLLLLLTSPVGFSDLQRWLQITSRELGKYKSEMQGARGITAGLSLPIVFMGNLGSAFGQNFGETNTFGHAVGLSETNSTGFSYNQGVSESISSSHSEGVSKSESISQGESHTYGTSQSEGLSYSEGASYTEGVSRSDSVSSSQGLSHTLGQSYTDGYSQGVSGTYSFGESETLSSGISQGISESYGTSQSTGLSQSYGTSESYGQSNSLSSGYSNGYSQNWSTGYSEGVSDSIGTSQTISQGVSTGISEGSSYNQSEGYSASTGYSFSEGTSSSIGSSLSEGVSHVVGASETTTQSLNHGFSASQGTSASWGTSQGYSANWSEGIGLTEGISSSSGGSFSQSSSTSEGVSTSYSSGYSQGYSFSQGTSEGFSTGMNWGNSTGMSESFNHGGSQTVTQGASATNSEAHTVTANASGNLWVVKGSYGESFASTASGASSLSNAIGESWGNSVSGNMGYSSGLSVSHNEGISMSAGESVGQSWSAGGGTSNSVSQGTSEGANWSNGVTSSTSQSSSQGAGFSYGTSESTGLSQSTGSSFSFGESSANAISENYGSTISSGISQSEGVSISNGISTSEGYSSSFGTGYSYGTSESSTYSNSQGVSQSTGTSSSTSQSTGMGESVSTTQSASNGISYSAGESNSLGSSQSYGISESSGISYGSSSSLSEGTSESWSTGNSNSASQSYGTSVSDGFSETVGISQGFGTTVSEGTSATKGTSTSVGKTVSEGVSVGRSEGIGTSISDSIGLSKGTTTSEGISQSQAVGKTESETTALAVASGMSNTRSLGSSSSMALGPSISYNKSAQWFDENKANVVEVLDEQRNRLMSAIKQGAFYVDVYILTADEESKKAASVLATTAWYGDVWPSPIQVVEPDPVWAEHLMAHASVFSACTAAEEAIELMEGYKFSTVLLPEELSAYCHPPRFEGGDMTTVFEAIPYFRLPGKMDGEAFLGWCVSTETGKPTEIEYRINRKNMMHTLISGSSGSGKTVTSLRFISELSNNYGYGATILDWKDDWRSLMYVIPEEKFRFYSLGTTPVNRLQFNPLAIPDGVDVDLWVDSVVEAFCLGFGLGQRGYEILWRNLGKLYSKHGAWKDTTRSKHLTLMDLYNEVDNEIKDKGARKQAGFGDVEAYNRVLARMGYFTNEDSRLYGMFGNPEHPVPIEDLAAPGMITVLEAQGMKGPQKSFLLGLVAAGIFQVARVLDENGKKRYTEVEHMIVFEEAHQVIKGADGDDAAAGVTEESTYEVMWNEARSAGLYMVALAQMPTHMPGSVLANTRVYITHQMGSDEDIDFLARRMLRDPKIEHKDFSRFFEKVPLGWAAVQTRRIEKHYTAEPVLVKIEMIEAPRPSDDQLRRHMINIQGFELEA